MSPAFSAGLTVLVADAYFLALSQLPIRQVILKARSGDQSSVSQLPMRQVTLGR